jgi:hypothetical protein
MSQSNNLEDKMGQYINPTTLVKEKGLKLTVGVGNISEFERAKAENQGLLIVGYYNRGPFDLCPVLPDADEFMEFESQYNRGLLVDRQLYALDPSVLKKDEPN